MDRVAATPDRATFSMFFTAVLIGGANFLAVKFTLGELAPLWGAGARFAAAAVLLFILGAIGRKSLPAGRAFWGAVLYGLLAFGLGYALIYVAMRDISVGTASVIMAAVPLSTLLLAVAHRQERLHLRGVVGGLLALGGIAVLSLNRLSGDLPLIPMLLAVAAMASAAEATVLVKGFPKADPITTNSVGMAAGAIALLVASLFLREPWLLPQTPKIWGAMIWLVVPGSVGLFFLFVSVVRHWTASATAYALTLMPVIAVTLGALFAGETVTIYVLAGAGMVILGVYVGALKGALTSAPLSPQPPSPGKPEKSEVTLA